MVQLSHPYMTTGKTVALIKQPMVLSSPNTYDCHADMGEARKSTKCGYRIVEMKPVLLYRILIILEILRAGSSWLPIGGCSVSMWTGTNQEVASLEGSVWLVS